MVACNVEHHCYDPIMIRFCCSDSVACMMREVLQALSNLTSAPATGSLLQLSFSSGILGILASTIVVSRGLMPSFLRISSRVHSFAKFNDLQAFSAWIHICAIRLFTESILRYGVPPEFLTALVKPNPKSTTKLRRLLASMFASNGALNERPAPGHVWSWSYSMNTV